MSTWFFNSHSPRKRLVVAALYGHRLANLYFGTEASSALHMPPHKIFHAIHEIVMFIPSAFGEHRSRKNVFVIILWLNEIYGVHILSETIKNPNVKSEFHLNQNVRSYMMIPELQSPQRNMMPASMGAPDSLRIDSVIIWAQARFGYKKVYGQEFIGVHQWQ